MTLTSEQLALLRDDLQPLSALRPGLGERALAYVVGEGDDPALLSELLSVPGSGKALRLSVSDTTLGHFLSPSARGALLRALEGTDAALLYRLALVYNCASMADARALVHAPLPDWLEVFLREAMPMNITRPSGDDPFGASTMEAMLIAAGQSPDLLARAAMGSSGQTVPAITTAAHVLQGLHGTFGFCRRLLGFREYLERHPQVVADALQSTAAASLAALLGNVLQAGVSIAPWRERLVELALGPQKTVREAAQTLLRCDAAASFPLVAARLAQGARAERLQAASLLPRLGKEQAISAFREALGRETDAEVRAAMEPAAAIRPAAPQRVPIAERPLTAATRAALAEMLAAVHAAVEPGANPYPSVTFLTPLDDAFVEAAFTAMHWGGPPLLRVTWMDPKVLRHVLKFVERDDLDMPHVVRLALSLNLLRRSLRYGFDEFVPVLDHFRRARGATFGLDDVAAVVEACGLPGSVFMVGEMAAWEDDAVWPYVARHLDLLAGELAAPPERWELTPRRPKLFELVAKFPTPPPELVPTLWDIALGAAKGERAAAQRALERLPDLDRRLLEALSSSRQHVRAEAAAWLGRRGVVAARKDLFAAMKREKQEPVRDEMMGALERLGASIDELIDLPKLLVDAERKAAVPAGLAWFPFDGLSVVRWQRGGEVPASLVRFLVAGACARKNPEPGASLRRTCAWFEKDHREALGRFILQAWIAQDTIPAHTPDEAAKLAEAQARSWHTIMPERTYEQLYRSSLDALLSQCAGSAIGEKGVLAVVAACGGEASVRLARAYVTTWYGNRAAHCKALVAMLAWIDHSSAVQFLLRTASGFRTRGIQEEAARHVALLAERKGWSVDELADRTVPRGGLDDAGDVAFSYGSRGFRAHLVDSGELVLEDDEGRFLKALPEARKDDDAALVEEARKQLATVRKECKALVKAQAERLAQAMCTERTWSAADWRSFVVGHPIVGNLARRLVWMAEDGRTLRPTADGTLLDALDEEVQVDDGNLLRLAHVSTLAKGDAAAWKRHLVDHRVKPPFEQLEGEAWALPDALQHETSLREAEGYMVEAFKLRGRATKLGYQRGATGDGGWFTEYVKRFSGADLDARIAFTGNRLPEENRTVALEALSFQHVPSGREVPLAEVPRVLLSACVHDLRQLAAAGTGYDADWRTKTPL